MTPILRAALVSLVVAVTPSCTAGEGVRGAASPTRAAAEAKPDEAGVDAAAPGEARRWRAPDDDAPARRSSGPAPKVASIAEFEARAARLRCEREIRCGQVAAAHLDRCVRDGSRLAHELLGVRRGVDAGRYTFDPEAAGECLQLLAESGCHVDALTLPSGCLAGAVPSYLRPAVASGGACERWEECIDGLCDGELGCPGVCRPRTMEVGGSCDNNTLCGDDLFCEDRICKPRGDVGDGCSAHWQACKSGLECVGASSGDHEWGRRSSGTCERPRGRDQRCGRKGLAEACRADLFCDYGAESPRCRDRLPEGAACRWLDACADGLTCAGLTLAPHAAANGSGMRAVATPGVCTRHADVGTPCDPEAEFVACTSDLRCDAATRRCVARGREGDPCVDHRECAAHHTCDPRRRTCQPQLPAGAACRPGSTDEFNGPCFLGLCDPKTRRCVARCERERARRGK